MTRILVIEDEREWREWFCNVLHTEGHDTFAAENGDKSIELAFTHIRDAILCDLSLYERNGPDIYTTLRENPIAKNIPLIIMVASYCGPMDVLPPLYLMKPFHAQELIDIVRLALKPSDTL